MSKLERGQSLGEFEILDALGSGGMGDVYRARDNALGRDVAIKVLQGSVAENPDDLARFMREARTLAALEHPNIASIYAVGEHEGTPFLVMELLPGETLADRLERGPVAVPDALAWMRQVALALEAAHKKGIVHRDLKPSNIQVDADDKITVLDFGLAKIVGALSEGASSVDSDSESPTRQLETRQGVILGTTAYMSPEQARGQSIDKRTDIWSFGCVLFEVLTGRKAFPGETLTDTLAAVVTSEPDWSLLPASTPHAVRRVLRRCLEKSPANRLQDVGDARLDLQETSIAKEEEWTAPRVLSPRTLFPFAAGLLVGALALGVVWMAREKPVESTLGPTARLSISLASGVRTQPGWHVDISPDGSLVAFTGYSTAEDKPVIRLRPLDSTESRALPGTEGGRLPFFSPDGRWIGFFDGESLKKVSTEGGPPIRLGKAGDLRLGVSWSSDDFIYFPETYLSGIVRVSANGGSFEPITELGEGESAHYWPDVLPGGRVLLYTSYSQGSMNNCEIRAFDLDTKQSKLLIAGGYNARYVPSGHLVYGRAGSLLAVPFQPDGLEVLGEPVVVVDSIHTVPDNGTIGASFSNNGTLVYVEGGRGDDRLVWVDPHGGKTPAFDESRRFETVRLSPDGRYVAAVVTEGIDRSIWLADLARGGMTRLTYGEDDIRPTWSSDGKWLFFTSAKRGPYEIFRVPVDGSAPPELFREGPPDKTAAEVSPDGSLLAYVEDSYETGYDIVLDPIDGSSEPIRFLATNFWELNPTFSPDGKWVAYQSDDSGRDEIYVRPLGREGGKTLVSTQGGVSPVWARSGDRIFYSSANRVVSVAVRTEPKLELDPARIGFDAESYRLGEHTRDYDVAPEGDRLLMIETKNPLLRSEITVVVNWFQELKRLAPVAR